MGFKVKALIHYNSRNNWGWLENSKYIKDIEVITGDIRDYDLIFRSLQDCSHIFHLAALIGIPYSYISPEAYVKTNIMGTLNVLQAAKQHKVSKVIITSTSETYGTAQYIPIDEDHPLVGQSPYSASKIGADHLALSFHRSFDLPLSIVRPFNTYGPRQSARAVIPSIIIQMLNGSKKLNLGNLSPTRDFTFVKDTAAGMWAIAKSEKLNGQVCNIGMGSEISIRQLAEEISLILKKNVEINEQVERTRPEKSEVERLLCDNSKIKRYTDWKPQFNLKSGLEETIKWISDNFSWFKPDVYNV